MGNKIKTRRVTSSFILGLFVVIGSMILAAVVIWLGATEFFKQNKKFVTYFDVSISGLDPGSPVKYLGVPVGTVSKIQVAEDGKLIEVIMDIDSKINITDSLRAKSEMLGIAGGKYIQLYYPSNPLILLSTPKINFKTPFPLIKSSPSQMEEIEIAFREVIDNLNKIDYQNISNGIVHFLNVTSKFIANKDIYDFFSNVKDASFTLSNILIEADSSMVIKNLKLMSERLLVTSYKLDSFANNLNAQIAGLKLKEQIDGAFAKYDSTINEIKNTVKLLGFRVETLLFGFNELLEETKTTNKQLNKSLRTLSDNPSKVFFSQPPLPEK